MATTGTERYSRISLMLVNGGTKITRQLFEKYVRENTPANHVPNPWTIDQFLCANKDKIIANQTGRAKERIFFPGADGTNINHWDLYMFCFILIDVCEVTSTIKMDACALKKLRNKLSHLREPSIDIYQFDHYVMKLSTIFARLLTEVGDSDLKSEVDEVIKSATDGPLSLTDTLIFMHQFYSMEGETRETLSQQSQDFKDMSERMKQMERKIDMLYQSRLPCDTEKAEVPDTIVELHVKNCVSDKEKYLSKLLVDMYKEAKKGKTGSQEEMSSESQNRLMEAVRETVERFAHQDRSIEGAEQKCVLLRVRCSTLASILSLFEDNIDGSLNEEFRTLEAAVRQMKGFEGVSIEAVIYEDEVWKAFNKIVFSLENVIAKKMNEEFRPITDMPNRNVQGITGVQLVERVSPTAEDDGRIQHSVRLTVKTDTEGRAQLKKSLKSGQVCNSINTLRDEMVKEFNLNSLSIEAKLLEPDDKQTKEKSMQITIPDHKMSRTIGRQKVKKEEDLTHLSLEKYLIRKQNQSTTGTVATNASYHDSSLQDLALPAHQDGAEIIPLLSQTNCYVDQIVEISQSEYSVTSKGEPTRRRSIDSTTEDSGIETASVPETNSVRNSMYSSHNASKLAQDMSDDDGVLGNDNVLSLPNNKQRRIESNISDSRSDAQLIKHGIKLNVSYLSQVKAKRNQSRTVYQKFLEPYQLQEKLREDPEKYIPCVLHLEGSHEAYCIPNVANKKLQRIIVSGRSKIGQAYNEDEVVIEILDNKKQSEKRFGKVLGVLKRNRCEGIKHPVFLCTPDDADSNIVRPMCKTVPKINILQEETRRKKRTNRKINIYDYDEYAELLHNPREEVINQAELQSCIFLVAFIYWDLNQLYPKGAILKRFPCANNLKAGIAVLNLKYEISRQFSRKTFEEVNTLLNKGDTSKHIPSSEVTDDSIADMTDLCTFTIDRHDSKDFNYAFSIQEQSGYYKVGVHIIDVSLYVTEGSPINDDALQRVTTIYSEADNPRYMLPDHIATELCSLLEHKKRPVISIYLFLNESGYPVLTQQPNHLIERSFIKCCKNLSYLKAVEKIRATSCHDALTMNLKALSRLIKKVREHRLGRSRFVLRSNEIENEDTVEGCLESHLLAEELVILANKKISSLFQTNQFCVPLVTKLPLTPRDLENLRHKYGDHLGILIPFEGLHSDQSSNDTLEYVLQTNPSRKLIVTEAVWNRIKMSPDVSIESILNDNIHPIQCVMYQELLSNQGSTFYECSFNISNVGHHNSRWNNYCQCTAPTRRYIDLVVQRLIHCFLKKQQYWKIYSREDIEKICSHANRVNKNVQYYQNECRNLINATALQKNPKVKTCFVKSVSSSGISVVYMERGHFGCQDIPFKLFDIGYKPEMSDNRNTKLQQVKGKWRKRYYDRLEMPLLHKNEKQTEADSGDSDMPDPVQILNHNKDLIFIKLYDWAKLLCSALDNRQKDLHQNILRISAEKDDEGENDISTECSEKHSFTIFSFIFHIGQPLQIQVSAEPMQGIIAPKPVLCEMTNSISICFQHFNDPVLHLSQYAISAAQDQYKTCIEYKEIWMPILSMEASLGAISNEESFYIKNVKIDIIDETRGKFSVPVIFCAIRNIGFSGVFTEETETTDEDESRFSYDWICIRKKYSKFEQVGNGRYENDYHWIGHAEITDVKKKPKRMSENQCYIVTFKLHNRSGTFPVTMKDKRQVTCNMEILRKTEVDRRIESFMNIFPTKGHQLAVQIALKRKQAELERTRRQQANSIERDLIIHSNKNDPRKKPLPKNNTMQQRAIDMALNNRFMLIQGPPGTGKTYTGIKLVYLFNKINNNLYKTSNEVKRHVLFCGPSNKSVDLVGRWMLNRLGDLCPDFVRIYGKATESRDYPIPGISFSSKGSAIHEADSDLKRVSLHHLIRSEGNIYAAEINAFEAKFRAENRRPDPKPYHRYLDLLRLATSSEIRKHDIILCTTGVASNPNMLRAAEVYQIIIDEAGMCSEPQCMVPIMASKAEQVVLIGDHKQLRPVIKCMAAADLGLEKSLFERYATTKDNAAPFVMLNLQYRLNPSLCKFPSDAFYDGRLETRPGLWNQGTTLDIWPTDGNGNTHSHVLIHVEGAENVLSVSTDEGNEQSKSNMEEIKIVIKVYRYLIEEHVPATSINIISQYNAQCSDIKEELKKEGFSNYIVNTVVSSQGGEWDYVIFSTVRSLPDYKIEPNPTLGWCKHNLGFITDKNQINVALTRARKGLIIIGNKNLLNCDPVWKKLVSYYEQRHCVKSPDEFPPTKRSRRQKIKDSQRQNRLKFGASMYEKSHLK